MFNELKAEFIKRVEYYEEDLGPDEDTKLVRAICDGADPTEALENSYFTGMIYDIEGSFERRDLVHWQLREWLMKNRMVRAKEGDEKSFFNHYGISLVARW